MRRGHPPLLLAVAGALLVACHGRSSSPATSNGKVAPAPTSAGVLALAPIVTGDAFDARIQESQRAVRELPADAARWVSLADAFVELARRTGDSGLYSQAHDASIRALQIAPRDVPARRTQARALQAQHRFVEMETLGEALVGDAGKDSLAWAVLGDAQLERGRYAAAVDSYQKMVDLAPGLGSYTRIAWIRWITGDALGAEEMQRMAVDGGGPEQPEAWAWCTAELGRLILMQGKPASALAEFDLALRRFPNLGLALLGRGRALVELGRVDEAIPVLREAAKRIEGIEPRWLLADVLDRTNRGDEARLVRAEIERTAERTDPRTYSLYLSTRGVEPERALRLAQREREARQDVFTDDVLAFALFRAGRIDDAAAAIHRALALGTPDARMHYHAGIIARARHDHADATAQFREALHEDPFFDPTEADDARRWLARKN